MQENTSDPYVELPTSAFWKLAVADPKTNKIAGLWAPKFRIKPRHKIATSGSCFAQHIGRALGKRGYAWTDFEPAPPYFSDQDKKDFNYGVFSFRTGNIYTALMLRQWLSLAFDDEPFAGSDEFWESDGRFFDPLRPMIEPNGFDSAKEMFASRNATLAAIRHAVLDADIFVFTLGLTESWANANTGMEYAICPGTFAGKFDPKQHRFVNHSFRSVFRDLRNAIVAIRKQNNRSRILLTVSPVPLTATASGSHVVTATTYSKSVLRAVAGELADNMRYVDYFPSYEIITSTPYKAQFYASNQRSVTTEGVDFVMQNFFQDQERAFGTEQVRNSETGSEIADQSRQEIAQEQELTAEDVVCEEEMLNAFAKK